MKLTTKTITRRLDCKLSKDDLVAIGHEMSQKSGEIDTIEAMKKRLKPLREDLSELGKKIANGTEKRDVTCEVRYHVPVNGKKSIVRLDTDEVIEVLNMTPEEMQEDLFQGGQNVADEASSIVVEEGQRLWPGRSPLELPDRGDSGDAG
jgi:hypothetical protein